MTAGAGAEGSGCAGVEAGCEVRGCGVRRWSGSGFGVLALGAVAAAVVGCSGGGAASAPPSPPSERGTVSTSGTLSPQRSTVPAAGTTSAEAPVPGETSKLSEQGRAALREARRAGASEVELLVAAERGREAEVVAAARAAGARVLAEDAAVGYARLAVPVERAEAFAALAGVRRVDVDQPVEHRLPEP
ncbi:MULTISPECIES: hypothetical protein [Actinosynnema]|uniref:hypothetical protein n=1 Tax=Actinosynnema TaxID=40566 RepID=UPI0020A5906D|nr:hypothetical protein [Actinosynnema pretiosum]MCP2097999.1 hypothetical protein [Actinosynnema pretiosum]